MRTAWRIVKEKYAANAFTGEGARLYGGRWNSPGTRMVYAAESRALAMLEMLVHLDSAELLSKYVLIPVEFDPVLVTALNEAELPGNWKDDPAPAEVQGIGDRWVASGSSVALAVPSVLVPRETNFLFHPGHPDFSKLGIGEPEPFRYDTRFTIKHR